MSETWSLGAWRVCTIAPGINHERKQHEQHIAFESVQASYVPGFSNMVHCEPHDKPRGKKTHRRSLLCGEADIILMRKGVVTEVRVDLDGARLCDPAVRFLPAELMTLPMKL